MQRNRSEHRLIPGGGLARKGPGAGARGVVEGRLLVQHDDGETAE